jgi:AraC-like DNA-binding protein
LELEDVPSEHRFEQYRSLAADVVDVAPLVDESTFRASSVQYFVDGIIVGRSPHDPVAYRRRSTHVADGVTDAICVQLFLEGRMRGVAGDHAGIDLHTANVGVQDFARSYAATTDRSDTLFVYLPRDRVDAADTLYRHNPSVAFARSSPRGTALTAAVMSLCQSMQTASRGDAHHLAATFVDTLNRVLRPGDLVAVDRDVRARLDAQIRSRLDDPGLGVDDLCDVAGYSRASIYRLFRRDGGVDRLIRTRRLRRCLDELTRLDRRRGAVGDVAARWGFTNPSHFTRLFRAEFGVPPSSVLAHRGPVRDPSPSTAAYEQIITTRLWQHVA